MKKIDREEIKGRLKKRYPMQYNRLSILHLKEKYLRNRRTYLEYCNTDIFAVDKIPQNLYYNRCELFSENGYYGIEKILRDYIGVKKPIQGYIEHGIFNRGYIAPNEYYDYETLPIITFGTFRQETLRAYAPKIKIITTGPYIAYAPNFSTPQVLQEMKQEFGKVITVFPHHSIDGFYVRYEKEGFIKQIYKIAEELNADTVFVCGYWKDYLIGNMREYEKTNFKLVTAGHAMAQNFLCKLKDIIALSDYVISNTFGTYVGYAAAMKKPFLWVPTNTCVENAAGTVLPDKDGFKWARDTYNTVEQLDYEKQKEMTNYIFGLDCIKTREELKRELDNESKDRKISRRSTTAHVKW